MLKSAVTVSVNCNMYRASNSETTILATERFFGLSTDKSSSKQPSPRGYRETTQSTAVSIINFRIKRTSCEINIAKQT